MPMGHNLSIETGQVWSTKYISNMKHENTREEARRDLAVPLFSRRGNFAPVFFDMQEAEPPA